MSAALVFISPRSLRSLDALDALETGVLGIAHRAVRVPSRRHTQRVDASSQAKPHPG
jgi:hypothetical protein